MPQVFSPATNTLARLSLFGLIALPALVIGAFSGLTRSGYFTDQGVPFDQPVPFSHKHHAEELGIDCRYCHTSVEKSAFAGIPPTHTCMSCHSQVWTNSPLLAPIRESYQTNTPLQWQRVNKLPEFVYFSHDIHISRGINCNVCHGPIQKMQLTYKGNSFFMSFCTGCHRDPERYLYKDAKNPNLSPTEQVFALYGKAQRGDELSAREQAIMDGHGIDYVPSPDEREEGEKLVKKLGVKESQLLDCYTCHR